ncbi:DUF1931 family protein [Streptomyces sp. NPDC052023]|uniref:DUF1931 family protein n=1 Tax=Streptomyces sp. NPDC052023 TaxID=3365681 RepID=UPI0037D2DBE6
MPAHFMLLCQGKRGVAFSAWGAEALSRGLCESRPGNSRWRAKANGRNTVEPWDLPITKGLQESIHRFRQLDEEVELKPILEQLAAHPPLDRTPTQEAEDRFPEIIGGLSVAVAETFKIMYPDVKNPQTSHWEGVTAVFDRLL